MKQTWKATGCEEAVRLINTYFSGNCISEKIQNDALVILSMLGVQRPAYSDKRIQSYVAMIQNDHLWKYWYYDGVPLSVRVAYWAAVKTCMLEIPKQYSARWSEFCINLAEIKARDVAIMHSNTAGGWLFPGEPQILWEIVKIATQVPGDICELGSWIGRSATILCAAIEFFSPDRKVLLVDNWKWGFESDLYPFMIEHREILLELEHQLSSYSGIYQTFTGTVSGQKKYVEMFLGNKKLALLFHDASHEYDEVCNDLESYLPLLETGGYLVVHDYKHPDYAGTRKAVDDIVMNTKNDLYQISNFNTLGLFRKGIGSDKGESLSALGVAPSIQQ